MLEVATEVFCQRGYAGAAMNEIAERCGVTKPMLYLYFDSKPGLYRACLTFVGDGLIAAIERAVAAAETPAATVLATAGGLFAFAEQRNRQWWGVIYSETMPVDTEVAQLMADYRARIYAVVHRAVADLLSDRLDTELAANALIGAGESVLRWWVAHPEIGASELTERLGRMVLPILAAGSARG